MLDSFVSLPLAADLGSEMVAWLSLVAKIAATFFRLFKKGVAWFVLLLEIAVEGISEDDADKSLVGGSNSDLS